MKFFFLSLLFVVLLFNRVAYSVDDSDIYPKMVYWSALKKGDYEKVSSMLEQGISANIIDSSGMTPLAYAIGSNKKNLITLLLKNKANVNAVFKNKMTALIYAAVKNRYSFASYLIDNGAGINMQDDLGRTALMVAIEKDHTAFVKEIIKFNFDKDITDYSGKTIYDYIEYSRNEKIIKAIKDL